MKITFIGLGRMGSAMVHRLLDAGHQVVVYNRTAEKLAEFIARSAIPAQSVREAAGASAVTITMLADDRALSAVAEGPDGVIASLPKGGIHVAMGTHGVQTVRTLAELHDKAGQTLVAAPMLGRPEAVAEGRAGIIAGGAAQAVATCRPALAAIGQRIFPAGDEPGAACALKLANNMLLACAIEATGEAFALIEKSGGDREVFRDVLVNGLFSCPAYKSYATIIAAHAYHQVGITATLALKDVNLALAAGQIAAVPLPSVGVCRDRLLSAMAYGGSELDWAVMAREQARASGLDWRGK